MGATSRKTRQVKVRWGTCLGITACLFGVSCKSQDRDQKARDEWISAQTTEHRVFLWRALNGSPDIWYYDGWYPIERDAKTGGACRWQEKKSTTRFRRSAIPAGDPVRLSVFGWTDAVHLDVRTSHLDFFVNGVRIDRFDTPKDGFEHVLTIPRELLGNDEWVDLMIVAANTTRPDWRDLGFATTGFLWRAPDWKPDPPKPPESPPSDAGAPPKEAGP